jgi:uncharacterized oligopeptide transporter (OPT) family protein
MDADPLAPNGQPPVPGAEATVRALLAGLGIGVVLTIGNIYMGLKTGWWDSQNITAAVVGFALLGPSARLGRRPYTLLENNVTQTAASSAGVMPATLGLLGALPALELLGHHYPLWAIGVWGLALGVFGILLAVPLRQRFVVDERLPFPSAIATAEVIRAVHGSSQDARARTRVLLAGLASAAILTWFRDGRPAFIPGELALPLVLAGAPAGAYRLGLAVSPMLFSTGVLVGLRTALSLFLGSVVAWGLLGPALVKAGIGQADYSSLVSWLLWPGVAMVVASGLVSLAGLWRSFARAVGALSRLQASGQTRAPRSWAGLLLSAAAVVLTSWLVFGVHPLLGVGSVLIAILLIDVCVRTVGETDIAPLSALGQLVQLILGLIMPGKAPVNIASASVTAGAGAQSAVTVSVLKTGQLLGAPPSGQIRAQLLGAVMGLFVAMPAYAFLRSAHGLGGATLPAPGALGWKALAALAENGSAAVPPWAGLACLVAGALGVALTLLEKTRVGRFVPSPVALAAAFLVPASTGFSVALGALTYLAVRARRPHVEAYASSAAAGGIAGESLIGFAAAVLATVLGS